MNGYVVAGYLAVAVGLGGYWLWLGLLARRLRRRERELGVREGHDGSLA